jgi:hypothetical protein
VLVSLIKYINSYRSSPAFLEHGSAEKITACAQCTYKPWSKQAGGLDAFSYLAAQIFELFSNIQDQNKKIKIL